MPERMKVVKGNTRVDAAVSKWKHAFKKLGGIDHGFEKTLIWIDELGIWLNSKGRRDNDGGYWNGLGTVLGGRKTRNLVVQVNPPENGSPPGRFQGVVGKTANGQIWLLHRGELNVGGLRVNLKNYGDIAFAAGFEMVEVDYPNKRVEKCYRVACVNDDALEIVASTKRFINLCQTIRTLVVDGDEWASVQKLAGLFEEPTGPYTIGPQDAKEVDRVHGAVFEALRKDLSVKGLSLSNDRAGSLGPDLYTTGKSPRILFEIKTGNGASDILKATGQLVVYEKVLENSYRKVMVLPTGVSDRHRAIVESLDIEIIDYRPLGQSYAFDWPLGLLKAA